MSTTTQDTAATLADTQVRSGSRQCEAGAKVQRARETAGLSREDVAYRMHMAMHVRRELLHGSSDECGTRRCGKYFESVTRTLKQEERMSQAVFDRKNAERIAECGADAKPLGAFWDDYIAIIDLAPFDASEDDLRDAVKGYVRHERAQMKAAKDRKHLSQAARVVELVLTGQANRDSIDSASEFSFDALRLALIALSDRSKTR